MGYTPTTLAYDLIWIQLNSSLCVSEKPFLVITDKDTRFHVQIPQASLEYPSFDLVGWFVEHLALKEQHELTNSPIIEQHCCEGIHSLIGCGQSLEHDSESEVTDNSEYDDLPDLIPIANNPEGGWDDDYISDDDCMNDELPNAHLFGGPVNSQWEELVTTRLTEVLTNCQPFPGDGQAVDLTYNEGDCRFVLSRRDRRVLEIYDQV